MKVQFGKLISFFCMFFLPFQLFAQTDSTWKVKPILRLSGFVDIFYSFDFNRPQTNFRQTFLYNHNRHNEFNLNLGYIKVSLEHLKYRGQLALQAGTYAYDNYVAESGPLRNIYEANVGCSLNKENNLWLDVGIFGSHIGFESAPSIENWSLTRSLLAENTPYYLAGAKLNYSPNAKWNLTGIVCNGWQRIQKIQGNSLPSFGTQIKYCPNEKVMFNWSTFVGTDDPDSTRRMRYFNNFYSQFFIGNNLGIIAGIDIGVQQKNKWTSLYDYWYSPVVIARFSFSENWALAFRAEYYQDKYGIIIPKKSNFGFDASGLSINMDFLPNENLSCRIEARGLKSTGKIFEKKNAPTNNNIFITASIAVRFSQLLVQH